MHFLALFSLLLTFALGQESFIENEKRSVQEDQQAMRSLVDMKPNGVLTTNELEMGDIEEKDLYAQVERVRGKQNEDSAVNAYIYFLTTILLFQDVS